MQVQAVRWRLTPLVSLDEVFAQVKDALDHQVPLAIEDISSLLELFGLSLTDDFTLVPHHPTELNPELLLEALTPWTEPGSWLVYSRATGLTGVLGVSLPGGFYAALDRPPPASDIVVFPVDAERLEADCARHQLGGLAAEPAYHQAALDAVLATGLLRFVQPPPQVVFL